MKQKKRLSYLLYAVLLTNSSFSIFASNVIAEAAKEDPNLAWQLLYQTPQTAKTLYNIYENLGNLGWMGAKASFDTGVNLAQHAGSYLAQSPYASALASPLKAAVGATIAPELLLDFGIHPLMYTYLYYQQVQEAKAYWLNKIKPEDKDKKGKELTFFSRGQTPGLPLPYQMKAYLMAVGERVKDTKENDKEALKDYAGLVSNLMLKEHWVIPFSITLHSWIKRFYYDNPYKDALEKMAEGKDVDKKKLQTIIRYLIDYWANSLIQLLYPA